MNNETQPPDSSNDESRRYRFTFGSYTQTSWTDVRSLTWPDVATMLTTHAVGQKEGTCIVPAVFRGKKRQKADADQIDVAFLDSDTGHTLEEIKAAIAARGWKAIISSSHSHQTTRTQAKRGNWDKFLAHRGDQDGAAAAFLEAKGYQPEVTVDAQVVKETDEHVVFSHRPCPKFRVAVPLQRPWLARNYDDQREANAAWKERVEALASSLGLSHDQSCTDTSRLFYLPRRPADGPPAETEVLEGTLCDIFALPSAPKAETAPRTPGRKSGTKEAPSRGPRGGDSDNTHIFMNPATDEEVNLREWAKRGAQTFELRTALQQRRPSLFHHGLTDGGKHHLRCVNDGEHTQGGTDTATFVVNASESTSSGFAYHCRHAHCDGRDRLFFLRRMLEEGWLSLADLSDPAFHVDGTPPRPLIRFVAGTFPSVVDAAEEALMAADLGIYQRGAFVVRPGLVQVNVGVGQEMTVPRILEMEELALVEAMTLAASWERYDGRSESWVTIDAPNKVARAYRQRLGHWRLPVLSGLINAPTLRADGSLLSNPGYDPATGLLLELRGLAYPPIPPTPTIGAARAALQVLTDLIGTFPFVDDASRSVALSAILTACIRRSLRTAPLHAFTAPVAGSGKSMLVDLASVIVTGREAGVIAQGKTEEELEKRLGAMLLAGDQVIAIDNCEAPVSSEFLCSMLTQTSVRARILGRSEAPELPASAFVTATGNNLVLVGDLTRRAVLCRLDPKHERPELRRFDRNPVAEVHVDRGRYLVAALTILRAYRVAGMPHAPDPLGSFEAWSNWVRGALLWLDQADPVSTMEELREHDPRRDAVVAVVSQWAGIVGDRDVSVRDLIERATEQRPGPLGAATSYPKAEFIYPDFREALLMVAGDGGVINGKRLGKWLASQQDKIVDGKQIIREGVKEGVLYWRLSCRAGS